MKKAAEKPRRSPRTPPGHESEPARTLGQRCCHSDISPRRNRKVYETLARKLKALGHPIRIQLLEMLAGHQGQVCVCDLEAALPVKQPTVSHHLKILRDTGLVHSERRGQWAYYFVERPQLEELLAEFRQTLIR